MKRLACEAAAAVIGAGAIFAYFIGKDIAQKKKEKLYGEIADAFTESIVDGFNSAFADMADPATANDE